MSLALDDSCYMPPYGTVPRSSLIVLNMAGRGGGDGQFRKKMASKRTKDPLIQDFGDLRDWQASKTGVGRMGDDKVCFGFRLICLSVYMSMSCMWRCAHVM